jgi:Spy/CpxP family protein refolding chaperone
MTRPATLPRRAALAGAVAALVLATLVALPLLAQPPGGGPGPGVGGPEGAHGPGGFPLRGLAAFLDLTEQQIEDARALLEDLAAELRPLAEEARAVREELAALLDAADPDPAEVGALVVELHGIGDEMKAARDDFDAAFSALLTPDQLERWEVLKEARGLFRGQGRRGHHGRGPGPGPDGQGASCLGCGA